jgi:hypothetical protein
MAQGLTSTSGLATLKVIVGFEMLDQLYLILRDSLAINMHYNIQWDHKIIYSHQQHLSDIASHANSHSRPTVQTYTICSVIDNDMDFCILHKTVYMEIQQWSETKGF